MAQFGPHWTDFCEIILGTCFVEKICIRLKSERITDALHADLSTLYIVASDIYRSIIQKITLCCLSMTTLLVFVSFHCKQNGSSDTCVRITRSRTLQNVTLYLHCPSCYIVLCETAVSFRPDQRKNWCLVMEECHETRHSKYFETRAWCEVSRFYSDSEERHFPRIEYKAFSLRPCRWASALLNGTMRASSVNWTTD
jgi:hypothetical protein